jgi:hypothetical protein
MAAAKVPSTEVSSAKPAASESTGKSMIAGDVKGAVVEPSTGEVMRMPANRPTVMAPMTPAILAPAMVVVVGRPCAVSDGRIGVVAPRRIGAIANFRVGAVTISGRAITSVVPWRAGKTSGQTERPNQERTYRYSFHPFHVSNAPAAVGKSRERRTLLAAGVVTAPPHSGRRPASLLEKADQEAP